MFEKLKKISIKNVLSIIVPFGIFMVYLIYIDMPSMYSLVDTNNKGLTKGQQIALEVNEVFNITYKHISGETYNFDNKKNYVSILRKHNINKKYIQQMLDDKTFQILLIDNGEKNNISGHYNPNLNNLTLFVGGEKGTIQNPNYENNELKEIFMHEFMHYIISTNKELQKTVIKEVSKFYVDYEETLRKDFCNKNTDPLCKDVTVNELLKIMKHPFSTVNIAVLGSDVYSKGEDENKIIDRFVNNDLNYNDKFVMQEYFTYSLSKEKGTQEKCETKYLKNFCSEFFTFNN